MFTRTLIRTAALIVVLGAIAHGQWASIPHNPANPIFVEGFHVTHDDGGGVQEYSAFNRTWHPIAPAGSTILGTGDWTTLVLDTGGTYVGYSARLDDVAPAAIAPGSNLIASPIVEDDVILILAFNAVSGAPEAHAYSAQSNQWLMQPLVSTPVAADYAVSRFVICVRDGITLYGFGARTAAWIPFYANGAAPPMADGNAAAANALDASSNPVCVAFSGVLGTWAASPVRHGTSVLKVDHNVASMRAAAGAGQFRPCAYSAYNGTWRPSTTAFPVSPTAYDDIRDNVVYFGDPGIPLFEAIGTRPGLTWDPLPPSATIVDIFEDAILANDGTQLFAISGLAQGLWMAEPYPGVGVHFPGTEHLVLYQDGGGSLHTFSPAVGSWAPMITVPVAPMADDAVVLVDTATQLFGYASRWNQWISRPVGAAPVLSSTGGSISATQDLGTGNLLIFDERRNGFTGPFNPGGPSNMSPGRNLMLFESPAAMYAYSVQRSAFEQAPGAVLPSAAPPVAEENVAMFVDGAGQVFAYASPAEEHIWFDYPNGTEFQIQSLSALPGSGYIAYSILANPSEQVAWMLAPFRLSTGIAGGYTGLLWLDLSGFWYLAGPYAVGFPPPPNYHSRSTLPTGGPMNVQLWTQGLVHNGSSTPPLRLSTAPDPFWIF